MALNPRVVIGAGVLALAAAGVLGLRGFFADPFDTGAPLRPTEGAEIALLSDGFDPADLPDGWAERRFIGIAPTEYTMVQDAGRAVLRCATDASGSILARDTDIPVAGFPALTWSWKVTRPIDSDTDEATPAGDDHPARLFLRFVDGDTPLTTEIIWANRAFSAGDVKVIDGFRHLVAAGPEDALDTWHAEAVDLGELVRALGGDPATARLRVLGVFCDSDNTGTQSEAFFRDIALTPG